MSSAFPDEKHEQTPYHESTLRPVRLALRAQGKLTGENTKEEGFLVLSLLGSLGPLSP